MVFELIEKERNNLKTDFEYEKNNCSFFDFGKWIYPKR